MTEQGGLPAGVLARFLKAASPHPAAPPVCQPSRWARRWGPEPAPSPAASLCSEQLSGPRVAALRSLQEDPDPTVSCLATQTFYILEAKDKLPVGTPTSCFCGRRPRKIS